MVAFRNYMHLIWRMYKIKIQFNLNILAIILDLPVHGGSFNRYHLSIVDYGSINLQRNVGAFTT